MISQILSRTPPWVFLLFFALLALGYVQSRPRTVSRGAVSILPVAMAALSLYGVISAFRMAVVPLVVWLIGLALACVAGLKLARQRDVSYIQASQSFRVPGSWWPLALMMAIFCLRYLVAVLSARQMPIVTNSIFIASVAAAYGVFSGLFLARAAVILKSPSSANK